jgi:hypothetical protein
MNTTTQTKEQFVTDIIAEIKEMNSSEIFDLNNRFCESANYLDDTIYTNDEDFFEMLGYTASDGFRLACRVAYGDWNASHDYVMFDGYGNLKSFSYLDADNLPDILENIAEYVADNYHEFSDLFTLDIDNYEF